MSRVLVWWLVIALLLSVGLNAGLVATVLLGRRGGPPPAPPVREAPEVVRPGRNPLPLLPRFADRLGLEGEKRQKFLDLQWSLYQETSRLRLQLGEAHRGIRRELTREDTDRQRVDRLLEESARAYLELERSLVKHVLATRELLDPEQERQYLALIAGLRIAGAGAGLGAPADGAPRPAGEIEQRMEQRRQRRERFRERRFPGRRP